jgi:hypothetical protein
MGSSIAIIVMMIFIVVVNESKGMLDLVDIPQPFLEGSSMRSYFYFVITSRSAFFNWRDRGGHSASYNSSWDVSVMTSMVDTTLLESSFRHHGGRSDGTEING